MLPLISGINSQLPSINHALISYSTRLASIWSIFFDTHDCSNCVLCRWLPFVINLFANTESFKPPVPMEKLNSFYSCVSTLVSNQVCALFFTRDVCFLYAWSSIFHQSTDEKCCFRSCEKPASCYKQSIINYCQRLYFSAPCQTLNNLEKKPV